MLHAHSVAGIRAAEELAAAEIGWDTLMHRAARALADDLLDVLPAGLTPVVLVGPGNNGGDALFAAAFLRERGLPVNICLLDPDHVHAAGLTAARAAGVGQVDDPSGHAVVVDGVLGIGARAGLSGRAAEWARWQGATRPFTVAVDAPSGIGVDDGTLAGPHLVADRTVTFGASKPGLLLGPAADAAGEVVVADIGLTPFLGEPVVEAVTVTDTDLLTPAVPGSHAHKYTRGVLGIRAGSPQYAGAAHLAVAGGQAGLAGYVRFVGHEVVARRVVDRAPEVVAGDGRVQAWVVGPGGGDDVDEHLEAALSDGVPTVVDATALGLFRRPGPGTPAGALFGRPGPGTPAGPVFGRPGPGTPAGHQLVLTPHAGELASLLDVERDEVEADPWRHATDAAERFGATVLLKGHRTLAVTPGRPTRVNLSGTSWLGTAGSGDVLSGFVGSLLAAGLAPHEAASVGAFLHGAAGVHANPGGPLTASAVAAALPGVTAAFLAGRLTGERDW